MLDERMANNMGWTFRIVVSLCGAVAVVAFGVWIIKFQKKIFTCKVQHDPNILNVHEHKEKSIHHHVARAMDAHHEVEMVQFLQGMSKVLQMALQENNGSRPFEYYIKSLEAKMERIAECSEKNDQALRRLLLNQNNTFKTYRALPQFARNELEDEMGTMMDDTHPPPGPSTIFAASTSKMDNVVVHSYDSIRQVIAHLVRDWSTVGRPIRQSLYTWCLMQFKRYAKDDELPILVPGAGVGGLAFALAAGGGYSVEANELSAVMIAASQAVMIDKDTKDNDMTTTVLYPYLLDSLRNEIDAQRRFEAVPLLSPEQVLQEYSFSNHGRKSGSLTYTWGSFTGVYYASSMETKHAYGGVVTCFFLDTAVHLFETINVIQRLLAPDGIWINVGPLAWHDHSTTMVSVDELNRILQLTNWEIVHWSVDLTPVDYRGGDAGRTTQVQNAYLPLRFVVRKPQYA